MAIVHQPNHTASGTHKMNTNADITDTVDARDSHCAPFFTTKVYIIALPHSVCQSPRVGR